MGVGAASETLVSGVSGTGVGVGCETSVWGGSGVGVGVGFVAFDFGVGVGLAFVVFGFEGPGVGVLGTLGVLEGSGCSTFSVTGSPGAGSETSVGFCSLLTGNGSLPSALV